MTDRRRNSFVLLAVALLIGLAAVTIVAKKTRLGLDLKGGVELVYQAKPTAQSKVDTESLERAINIMRKRVDQLGVAQPEIQRSGADEIDVALPDVSNASRAQDEVGKTAQLYFYDWEPNVIGPNGKPAPTEGSITGDTTSGGAGGVTSGLLEYQAVLRAAKRPPILRNTNTTWTPGCTPAQAGGCIYGSWYLLDTAHENVLCAGGKPICSPAETEQNLYADGYKPPAGAKVKAVRVNPGTVVVQARPVETAAGKITNESPNSWYVLNDEPVLTGADITNPQQGNDETTGQPNVNFGFTSRGKGIFERITKKIAHRGQEAQLPSRAGSRSPRPRTWRASCSRAHCRSSWR
jgi:SecD/SecF fusion protein